MKLYPRKCHITGAGFNKGFKIDKVYIEDGKDADEYCQKHYQKSFQTIYDEGTEYDEPENTDFAYYTEWNDEDIEEQGYGYTEEGEQIFISKNDKIGEITQIIIQELEEIREIIAERGAQQDFTGDKDELLDVDLSHDDFTSWDFEIMQNHNYDLGAYHNLKRILEKIFKD